MNPRTPLDPRPCRELEQARLEKSIECPYCHWGFHKNVIKQHIYDKHFPTDRRNRHEIAI